MIAVCALTGTNSDQFTIISPLSSSFDIAAGSTQQVTMRFKPTSVGGKFASLSITNNADNASPVKTISLTGNGTVLPTKNLSVNPDGSWDFGNVTVNNANTVSFNLKNSGNTALSVSNIAISGANADQYTITSPSSSSFDIAAGNMQQITVRFKPTSVGGKFASLIVSNNSDNVNPSLAITLNGTGVINSTKYLVVAPDLSWDYGNVYVNNQNDKVLLFQNIGTTTLSISNLALNGTNSDQFKIVSPLKIKSNKQSKLLALLIYSYSFNA